MLNPVLKPSIANSSSRSYSPTKMNGARMWWNPLISGRATDVQTSLARCRPHNLHSRDNGSCSSTVLELLIFQETLLVSHDSARMLRLVAERNMSERNSCLLNTYFSLFFPFGYICLIKHCELLVGLGTGKTCRFT